MSWVLTDGQMECLRPPVNPMHKKGVCKEFAGCINTQSHTFRNGDVEYENLIYYKERSTFVLQITYICMWPLASITQS